MTDSQNMEPYITTASGRKVYFLRPAIEQIDIIDIAHGLSHLCRYVGQCNRFYSVAQHSGLCSLAVPDEFKLDALLHDASEAYLGDVPSPLKKLMPEYREIERRVTAVIQAKFGLGAEPDIVREVDARILRNEVEVLFNGHDLNGKYHDTVPLDFGFDSEIIPLPPQKAFMEFIRMFNIAWMLRHNSRYVFSPEARIALKNFQICETGAAA